MSGREMTIAIVANSLVSSHTMSGGDRILLELFKRWNGANHTTVDLYLCADAATLFQRNVPNVYCRLVSNGSVERLGVMRGYIIRLLQSISIVKNGRIPNIVFSSSDFLTDLVPSWLLSRRFRGSKLVCAVYLLAPSPFTVKYARSLRGFVYFFSQRIAIGMMKLWADRIYVLNKHDRDTLARSGLGDKVKAIRGGVDLAMIESVAVARPNKYDACFIGRIHEQKGIEDLIEIWKLVCGARRDSKLAIIGWGDDARVSHLNVLISEHNLANNIEVLGFLDGTNKIAILKSSRVFVFPSSRESWGLAVCEAMAAAVPVVSYDLPVLKETFPIGLSTVPLGNKSEFARVVLELLQNGQMYESRKEECLEIVKGLTWEEVAQQTLTDFRFSITD